MRSPNNGTEEERMAQTKIIVDSNASSKSKRNGEREASDKSFKIFKRERVVTPLPF
jgi:hypothetical protein